MDTAQDSKSYKFKPLRGSLLFIAGIALAICAMVGLHVENQEPIRIINITLELGAMFLGYILYICCIMDKQWRGPNLSYFLLLIVVDMFGLYTDMIAWLVDGRADLRQVNIWVNTVYYCTTPMLAYIFWRYVITFLNVEKERSHKYDVAFRLGVLVAIAIRFLNVQFGYYFTVNEDGVYSRQAFFPLSYIYSVVVVIMTLILVVIARRRFKRHQIICIFIYSAAPIIAGVISAFTYGLSPFGYVAMMTFLLMYCILNVDQGKEKSVAESELHMARIIQENMLPRVFPPFPNRHDFDIYASMTPAKEVGGDFYDFYLIDDDHIALVIADVSGKGIPAALYMMVSKSLVKSQTLVLGKKGSTARILGNLNDQFCENNDLNMFVTVWLGILTLSTGELVYSNAGHEYPIFKRGDKPFSVVKGKNSPPVGCIEGVRYKEERITLSPGDVIFLYTDGVAEATNHDQVLFGMDRVLETLNDPEKKDRDVTQIDSDMMAAINQFVRSAPQFDDITMLSFKYNGGGTVKTEDASLKYDEITVDADVKALPDVQKFVEEKLEAASCPMKPMMQISVAVEEIFVNIAHYAYKDKGGKGDATVKIRIADQTSEIVFIDSGVQFDPLSAEEPDVTLSAEEREIGGLGIFMTQKTMDDVKYEYTDGKNILTLKKKF